MTTQKVKYPGNPWGRLAADPWSPMLDPVVGASWDAAVEAARQMRIASTRTSESLARLQRERAGKRTEPLAGVAS